MRVRFAKRGRLRFTSHRDFQRAFERALRRANVPMAYSHGFTPHPKISFVGAAPMGAASEAEYLEISLTEHRDPARVRADLDAALPAGLDIVGVAEVDPAETGSLADQLQASSWEVVLPGAENEDVSSALRAFMAAESVEVERLTKKGMRTIDARQAVLHAIMSSAEPDDPAKPHPGPAAAGAPSPGRGQYGQPGVVEPPMAYPAVRCVIEHQTPTVRPEEILAALDLVAGFTPPSPARVRRLAQGVWDSARRVLVSPAC